MGKIKSFIEKNKGTILLASILVLFVALSAIIKDEEEKTDIAEKIASWYTDTKEGGVVVTVLSQTTCPNCTNFEPIMEKVQEEYGFKLYWFEVNEMTSKDRTTVTKTYDIDFQGTPHTFVTKNGELIDENVGYTPEKDLIDFLVESGVIEEKED